MINIHTPAALEGEYQSKDETSKIREQEQEGKRLIKAEQSSKTTA